MTDTPCPFCGLVTGVPHETQQGCIDALQAEIARVREVLEIIQPAGTSSDPPNKPGDRR
jgi:hypothetical protein